MSSFNPSVIKGLTFFLAVVILVYSIVSFIHTDPETKKMKPSVDSVAKGLIYLVTSIAMMVFGFSV